MITDERMPGMSGTALIREVRGIRPKIPIMLVTGHVGAVVVRRAREAGADEVLRKPVSITDLATSLARILRVPGIPGTLIASGHEGNASLHETGQVRRT